MEKFFQKTAKATKRFLIYLIEEVSATYYVAFFAIGVLTSALIYYFLTPYSQGIGVNGSPLVSLSFLNALYFSLVTVSSLGYGDMHPMGLSKIFACIEVLMGLIFMGVALAKLTSYRLSYHVMRLFRSDTQKTLKEFIEEFEHLQDQVKEVTTMLAQSFQDVPGAESSRDEYKIRKKFNELIDLLHSNSKRVSEYLAYEVTHSNFFTIISSDLVKQISETIDQVLFLAGQMLLSMTVNAKTLLLNSVNRRQLSEVVEKHNLACKAISEYCKDEDIKVKFLQITKTCDILPESFFAVPVPAAETGQPDQKLGSTNEPQS